MRKSIMMACILFFLQAVDASADRSSSTNSKVNMPADQAGRNMFLAGTTVLGLGCWGLTIPEVLGIDDPVRKAGFSLLGGGAGFFVPYFLTGQSRLTKGMAVMSLNGGVKGYLDGYLLFILIAGDDDSGRGMFGSMLGGSLAELYLFYKLAEKYSYSLGKSNLLTAISSFGYGYGFLALATLTDDISDRGVAASMLLGGVAGYLAANYIFNPRDYGDGDYTLPTISAYLSGLLPLSLMLAMDADPDTQLLCGISLASSIVGMWIGDRLVKDINLSTSQGNYIHLGTLGGALAAAGLVFAIGGDSDSAYRWLPLLSVAGGAGGMAIVYSTFKKKILKKQKTTFRLNVNPGSLALGLNEKSFSSTGFSYLPVLPAVSATLSF